MGTTSPTEDHGNDRAARIARVVEDVVRRRAGGEQVDVADIVDQHPGLMPELAERLNALGRIEPADRRAAETETAPDNFDRVGWEQPSQADPHVPSHSFPGYEIVRRISEGGQGIVYQALQKTTKRKVAIKVLLQGLHASTTARKRFEREIELVAALKHPNIITIFHSGTTKEGLPFYVMDYVRGLSLKEFVREKKLTLEDALKLFMKVCAAIQYAHQRGVMHRDLKPSNILVDTEGNPKVLDFGLAKLLAGPVETIVSISQEVIGTLPYMSPEQARGNPDEIDTRTDIYSLGVMLYELLTGGYPYPVAGRMADVLKHIAETEPTPPTRAWKSDAGVSRKSSGRFRPGQCPIDGEVQTIVMKSLSKDRDRRYQSAGDLARDIDNYLTGQPIEARRDSGWYVLRKALWRHRVPVAAALVMLLVGCVVLWGITEFRRANRNGWMA
ncbi:MAG: serine/threonine protein kinase, partial [Planctomycetes bacterium]|nr:serine/threonine protein kinase [Planctomycetota bacterium]